MVDLTDAQIEFLKKFHKGFMTDADIEYYKGNAGWESALGSSIRKTVDFFRKTELIACLDPDEDLLQIANISLRVPKIKEHLKSLNAKVSGTKAVLLRRCLELDKKSLKALLPRETYWVATKVGGDIVDKYLEAKLKSLTKCEDDVLQYLACADYASAARRVANHNASLPFPPGMGCSWSDWDTKRDEDILGYIYSGKPRALALYHPSEINEVRTLAAVMHLFGGRPSPRLCALATGSSKESPSGRKKQASQSNERVARLLWFFAIGQANLNQWRSAGYGFIHVSSCDDSCDSCKQLSEHTYPIESVPQLPHSLCIMPNGCRCCYSPAVK